MKYVMVVIMYVLQNMYSTYLKVTAVVHFYDAGFVDMSLFHIFKTVVPNGGTAIPR